MPYRVRSRSGRLQQPEIGDQERWETIHADAGQLECHRVRSSVVTAGPPRNNLASDAQKLRVAVAQLRFHPAARTNTRTVLADPFGSLQRDYLLPDKYAAAPRVIGDDISELRKELEDFYLKHLERRLLAILSECLTWKVDIVVFPEYSIPPRLLASMAPVAGDMVVVAGTHMVTNHALDQGVYTTSDAGVLPPAKGEAVCPVIAGGRIIGLQSKMCLVEEEQRLRVVPAGRWAPVWLPEREKWLGILICRDFLDFDSELIRQNFDIKRCDLLAVPALTSWHSIPTDFESIGRIRGRRRGVPVLLANDAAAGGSTIFVGEQIVADLTRFPERAGQLQRDEEGLIVAAINLAKRPPTKAQEFNESLLIEPIAAATLLYRCDQTAAEYIDWLDICKGLSGAELADHVEVHRGLLDRNARGTSARSRRLQALLACDLREVDLRAYLREIVLDEDIWPLPRVQAHMARIAAERIRRWREVHDTNLPDYVRVEKRLRDELRQAWPAAADPYCPVQLDPSEVRQLAEALTGAFSHDLAALERALDGRVGEETPLDRRTGDDSFHRLVSRANRQRWVEELLVAALLAQFGHEDLHTVLQDTVRPSPGSDDMPVIDLSEAQQRELAGIVASSELIGRPRRHRVLMHLMRLKPELISRLPPDAGDVTLDGGEFASDLVNACASHSYGVECLERAITTVLGSDAPTRLAVAEMLSHCRAEPTSLAVTAAGAPVARAWHQESDQAVRILFLAANPIDHKRLRTELQFRALRDTVRPFLQSGDVELYSEWALQAADLPRALNLYRPHVVHICGYPHDDGIILADYANRGHLITSRELRFLLQSHAASLRVAVFAMAQSHELAAQIGADIATSIGFDAVPHKALILFSTVFYRALCASRDIERSYQLAQLAVQVHCQEAEGLSFHGLQRARGTSPADSVSGLVQQSSVRALFLAAGPYDRESVTLDLEYRAISEANYQHAMPLRLYSEWATRLEDVCWALATYQPHIVHFAGFHSNNTMYLCDDEGRSVAMTPGLMRELLAQHQDIRCLIFNTAHSGELAESMSANLPGISIYGLRGSAPNDQSIAGIRNLYHTLLSGQSYAEGEVQFQNALDDDIPVVLRSGSSTSALATLFEP